MEEELLEEMIRDRVTQISWIEKKVVEQTKKFERVRFDLEEIRGNIKTGTVEHGMEMEQVVQLHEKVLMDYKEAKEVLDMKKQQQGSQLHLYNEVMKSVGTPESRDSSYVTRMQAQLCKAMHSMGMVETQLALVTNQSEILQKYLKDTMTETVEEKAMVELQIMNDLMMVDNVRREAETKTKALKEGYMAEKGALVDRIEREKEEPPEEDDDEEKEELMEILSQGREEIERMERENKEELEKLEALKLKVGEIKGGDFVEDIVTSIAEEFKEREEEEGSEDED
jgi:hypothetical protein